MVSAMLTHSKEIRLPRDVLADNCPFRESVCSDDEYVTGRCHLQDHLFGQLGVRDKPITTNCETGEIPDVCPLEEAEFQISLV